MIEYATTHRGNARTALTTDVEKGLALIKAGAKCTRCRRHAAAHVANRGRDLLCEPCVRAARKETR